MESNVKATETRAIAAENPTNKLHKVLRIRPSAKISNVRYGS